MTWAEQGACEQGAVVGAVAFAGLNGISLISQLGTSDYAGPRCRIQVSNWGQEFAGAHVPVGGDDHLRLPGQAWYYLSLLAECIDRNAPQKAVVVAQYCGFESGLAILV